MEEGEHLASDRAEQQQEGNACVSFALAVTVSRITEAGLMRVGDVKWWGEGGRGEGTVWMYAMQTG